MTKVAVIGQYFKTFESGKKALLRKEAKSKRSHMMVELEDGGYLVTPLSQIRLVKSPILK